MLSLNQIVFKNEDCSAFAALDSSVNGDLLDRLYDVNQEVEFECLYRGELKPDMAYVVPYLARLEMHSTFTKWFFAGVGQNWGVVAVVPKETSLAELRRHLRKLNLVIGPDGKELLLRYFDPRVMRIFAPICTPEQLRKLFGPIKHFIVESDSEGAILKFSLNEVGMLETENIQLLETAQV